MDDAEKKRAQAEADVKAAKEERDAAKQTYLQEAEKSSESDSNVKSAQEAAQNAQKKFDEAKSAADDLKVQQSKKQQDLLDAQAAADEAAKTYQSVKQKLEENEQAKSELEQAKKNVTVADDACSKAQTEYDALVQSWKKKQAAVAALNEKLQAVQSCDWENGYEFDAALEQSDERFLNLNKLIRAYIKAKEAETTAAQDQQKAKKAVQDADAAKEAAEQKKAAAKEAVEQGFSENKTQFES